MPRSRAATNGVTGGKPTAISVESVELNQGPLRCLRDGHLLCLRFCAQTLANVFCVSDKHRNMTVMVVLAFSFPLIIHFVHYLSYRVSLLVSFSGILTIHFLRLTLWRQNYVFNFSIPCIYNVNNTGTKQVRIMKQTAF